MYFTARQKASGNNPQKRTCRILYGMLLAFIVLLAGGMLLGGSDMPAGRIWQELWASIGGRSTDSAAHAILFDIRMPRLLLSFLVGGILSISGACMQGIFQNPMAEPYVLGVSAGSGLGATVAIVLGANAVLAGGLSLISLSALFFGLLTAFLVYQLSRVGGNAPTALLLCGISISMLLNALISLLMVLNRDKLERIVLWSMGSFISATWQKVFFCAVAGALCLGVLLLYARDLNALLFGEEQARTLGVNARGAIRVMMAVTTLSTAMAVSCSGVIGFVGLLAPHAMRRIGSADHRALLPLSFMAGGLLLMASDTLARTLWAPQEIPVGVITALLGVPFFLYLYRFGGRRRS